MARSRSGTRGRRGPRKPPRRAGGPFVAGGVAVVDPSERAAIELPATITVKDLAELLVVSPADIIRELIKSGIFATINQLIDRDTASLVAEELGYEVAEENASAADSEEEGSGPPAEAEKVQLWEEDADDVNLVPRAPRARIEVNASWPGVSRKTMRLPSFVVTSDAPMCWVMPPQIGRAHV